MDKKKAVKLAYVLVPVVGVLLGGAVAPEQVDAIMKVLTDIITIFAQ
ncbi:TPA: hypothetical protein ACSVZR_003516 [Bacillus cereus]